MRLLDLSLQSPEENLACDEFLLDRVEHGDAEILRFWESTVPFVVLGVSQVLREHVAERACEADGIPVLRRCSAGGCVLQGPGCLNYTLVLTHDQHPEVATIRGSYCYILGRVCEVLRKRGLSASHKGTSDIAIGGQKVSGNAQKRRRRAILHHGTLLYGMDPALMERYLREPAERPQYRGDRTHRGFVRCLPLSADDLRAGIAEAFGAGPERIAVARAERAALKALARDKYATDEWTYRR
ncbi:MAG: lipoate--protein ligase family protein [Candidatus Hydrogenedentes bacterium]|nr:lipoate--protein ligase family protein [Candidatus Hydrogenedentota bacterium]